MDRVATLLVRAADTRRKLFASLPWGYRLATVLLAMEGAMLEAWGRQAGALMLQAGVADMPPPGPKWKPEKPNVRDLPRGYCQDVAKRAYALALKKTGNPASAGDAMQDYLLKVLSGGVKFQKGQPFASTVSFILKGVDWAADHTRRQNDRGQSLDQDDDEGGTRTIDLVDHTFESNPYWSENPRQFEKLEDIFPPNVWKNEVLPATTKIHPDMAFYFALLSEGYTGEEIVQGDMLPDFSPSDYKAPVQTWNLKVQKAKQIIRDKARKYDSFNLG